MKKFWGCLIITMSTTSLSNTLKADETSSRSSKSDAATHTEANVEALATANSELLSQKLIRELTKKNFWIVPDNKSGQLSVNNFRCFNIQKESFCTFEAKKMWNANEPKRPTFFVVHANSRFAGQVDCYSFGEKDFINNPKFQKEWLNPNTTLEAFRDKIEKSLEKSRSFHSDSKTINPFACTRSQPRIDPSFVRDITRDLKDGQERAMSKPLIVP